MDYLGQWFEKYFDGMEERVQRGEVTEEVYQAYKRGVRVGRVMCSVQRAVDCDDRLEGCDLEIHAGGTDRIEMQLTNLAGRSIYVGVLVDDEMHTNIMLRPM